MAIENWSPELVNVLSEVEGVQAVYGYDTLPGTLIELPAIVAMPMEGSQSYGMSAPGVALHQVQITLYHSNVILPEANGQVVPFIRRIRDKLAANVKLNGSVAYCLPVEPPGRFYQGPGAINYGDKQHTGVIFRVVIKELEAVTVEP